MTERGFSVPDMMVANYFDKLTNQFFKILPIREECEESFGDYVGSLQIELSGLGGLMRLIQNDSRYLSLLAILEYLRDTPCSVPVVKREVFKAIRICGKLKQTYPTEGGTEDVKSVR